MKANEKQEHVLEAVEIIAMEMQFIGPGDHYECLGLALDKLTVTLPWIKKQHLIQKYKPQTESQIDIRRDLTRLIMRTED